MDVLDSCPKHNMVAYLEKSEGNEAFHEIIDFLKQSSIHHALTVSPVVSTTFVEQFWTSAKSKTINNVRHITAKVAGKSVSISEASIRSDLRFDDADGIDSLPNHVIFDAITANCSKSTSWDQIPTNIATAVICLTSNQKYNFSKLIFDGLFDKDLTEAQPTPSPTPTSEVPHEPQPDSSPAHTSEVPIEHQLDPSPRPSLTTTIPDSIPETSSGNLGGHSSSDKSLSGNEDQAKEIQHLKAQITKLKKQAKPVIKQHKAWLKSVSLKQRFLRKSFSKKHRVHKESVSKQGRKFAKKNAQDKGRTRDIVDEDKEIKENILSTEDVLSTDKDGVSTDMDKVSTEVQNEGTEEQVESTDGHKKCTEEEIATQATQTSTQTPTSTIFGDDETIAKVLINMSQAKAVSKEKEKGVELKDVEETDRPRPTSTRSLLTLKPLPKIDPKDKGKKKIEEEDESESEYRCVSQKLKEVYTAWESDEDMLGNTRRMGKLKRKENRIAEEKAANEALIRNFDDIKARMEADRLLAEKLQEQEREQFTIEERAKFLHDTIAAQRKFLAQQRSEAIRNRPPTKNQLRNQMMTYLKHVGNFKHAELKIKKFEEVQALYEKIKSEVLKEESKAEVKEEIKEEESTRKRKLGTRKKMKSRKRRYIQNTYEDDSGKENDDQRLTSNNELRM
ncbi:hypothetical protein Tco_0563624 [Tanacetum coccineum]